MAVWDRRRRIPSLLLLLGFRDVLHRARGAFRLTDCGLRFEEATKLTRGLLALGSVVSVIVVTAQKRLAMK